MKKLLQQKNFLVENMGNKMDETRNLPQPVRKALQLLKQAGGKPYIVGGGVRDLFMGKEPHDFDIASDLTPDEVLRVLRKENIHVVEKLGNNYGVVVGVFDGLPIEIATFRKDKYGPKDPHRPAMVTYSKTIAEDLSRRDFTMNAMAMDAEGNITDPYHGREDIQEKRLRAVGDPAERYAEDPLRMYRACRFVSQLGFTYTETEDVEESPVFVKKDFWKECNARNISMERVRQEMEKLLLGENPDKGLRLLMTSGLIRSPFVVKKGKMVSYAAPLDRLSHLENLEQNPTYHMHDAWEHTLQAVRLVPQDLKLRWAMLFHDAGKGLEAIRRTNPKTGMPTDYGHEVESARIVAEALTVFGYNDSFVKEVTWLVKNHMAMPILLVAKKRQMKHWVRTKVADFRTQKEMSAAFKELEKIFAADLDASRHSEEELETLHEKMAFVHQLIETQMPVHSSDLAMKGSTVLKMIEGSGLDIQAAFAELLRRVQSGNATNEETALAETLQKIVRREQEKKKLSNNN